MWTAIAEHVGQLRAVPDVEHPATHGRPLWPKLVLSLWYATAAILLGGGIGLVVGTIGKKDVSSLSWVAAGVLLLWVPWFLRVQSLSAGGGAAFRWPPACASQDTCCRDITWCSSGCSDDHRGL